MLIHHKRHLTCQIGKARAQNKGRRVRRTGHWQAPPRRRHSQPHQDTWLDRKREGHFLSLSVRALTSNLVLRALQYPEERAGQRREAAPAAPLPPCHAALSAQSALGSLREGMGHPPLTAMPINDGALLRPRRSCCPCGVALGRTSCGLPWLARSNSRVQGYGDSARQAARMDLQG